MPLKTLFLNPPSFENFDGGAGSRWPATREIESYWYPVWLAYPTGMLEGARLLDAPPHHITAEETIRTCKDYELLVLFTSTPGFAGDVRIAEAIKDSNPHIKIAFVGPARQRAAEKSLMDAKVIDVVCRKEFDYSIVEYAQGKPIEDILGISYRKNGDVVHNPDRPTIENLDALPHVTDVTGATWMSAATTCLSCSIPLSRYTRRADARRSAPSASGPRRSADTRGANAPPTTWRTKWPRRKTTGPT